MVAPPSPGRGANDDDRRPELEPASPSAAATARRRPPPPRRRRHRARRGAVGDPAHRRVLAIAIAGVVGYTMGHQNDAVVQRPTDFTCRPATRRRRSSTRRRRIAAKLDDSIVNITTRLSSGGAAAGTGIVISSNGLALTNNHVIADTEQLRVENSADGSMHSAKVLGYSVTADVALIKIQGVSGLTAAPIGKAADLAIGDAVVGLGNAGGNGGEPSIAPGRSPRSTSASSPPTPTARARRSKDSSRSTPASSPATPAARSRTRPAASSASTSRPRATTRGSRSPAASAGEAYAIPIQKALNVAQRITSGTGGDGIHVGATRGVLGVERRRHPVLRRHRARCVRRVGSGTPADDAGIASGDAHHQHRRHRRSARRPTSPGSWRRTEPNDKVRVTWTDDSGDSHRATIALESAPPA